MKFGEFLVSRNLVTKEQVEDALVVQNHTKQKIGRILRDLGHISQNRLNSALERHNDMYRSKSSYDEIKKQVQEMFLDEQMKPFFSGGI
jgi:hypothetical protein